ATVVSPAPQTNTATVTGGQFDPDLSNNAAGVTATPSAASSSLAGSVYIDSNNNGQRDPGEIPIPGATVTITGTDLAGHPVNAPVVADANGNYLFRGLFPGTYILTQTQPPDLIDGLDRAGTLGGVAGNDVITNIPVGPLQHGTNYEFGELGVADP